MGFGAPAHLVEVLGLPFLACAAMTGILGYVGLHVLKREIVFVDIAMAQVAAVGVIWAHLAFGAHGDSPVTYATALGLTLATAAFYALARRRVFQISLEAIIGVSYAIAAASALFLLGVAPGGHVHAQHMLAGSILWTGWPDLLASLLAFGAVGAVFCLLRRPFGRISGDYEGAVREGMRVVWWDFLFYTLIGVVITFAVRIGGVVVVFAFLIIPATIGTFLSARGPHRLWIGWTAGILGALLGLLFADRLDFSVGPAVALFLGVELALAGAWRRLPRLAAAGVSGGALVAYLVLLALAPAASDAVGGHAGPPPWVRAGDAAVAGTAPAPVEGPAGEPGGEADAGGGEGLEARFERAATAQERAGVVLQALERDRRSGLALALRFLEEDPPIFFRQAVVEALGEGMEPPLRYDAMRPFAGPVNGEAVRRLREESRGSKGS